MVLNKYVCLLCMQEVYSKTLGGLSICYVLPLLFLKNFYQGAVSEVNTVQSVSVFASF